MSKLRFTCLLLPALACGCAGLNADVGKAELKSAVIKTKSVKYFGGLTTTIVIKSDEAHYERVFPQITKRPPIKAEIRLTKKQTEQFAKVVNLINREQLWNQKDVTVKAVDGGERTFEFQIGKNKGKFKLINAAPKHLRPFLTEIQQLISSLDEAAQKAEKQ